jgi:hypothetical protein
MRTKDDCARTTKFGPRSLLQIFSSKPTTHLLTSPSTRHSTNHHHIHQSNTRIQNGNLNNHRRRNRLRHRLNILLFQLFILFILLRQRYTLCHWRPHYNYSRNRHERPNCHRTPRWQRCGPANVWTGCCQCQGSDGCAVGRCGSVLGCFVRRFKRPSQVDRR